MRCRFNRLPLWLLSAPIPVRDKVFFELELYISGCIAMGANDARAARVLSIFNVDSLGFTAAERTGL